jgi:hypothetical protein
VLADEEGFLRADYRRSESDSHPNESGNKAVASAFTDWLPDALAGWRE